jgi:hypothetical protein
MIDTRESPVVRREEWAEAHRLRDQLAAAFPACFVGGKGKPKRPLKIGIERDILQRLNVDPRTLSLALHDYTGGQSYLAACVQGAARVGLDGAVCGEVTHLQATRSSARLARRKTVDAARHQREAARADAASKALAALAFAAGGYFGASEWAHAAGHYVATTEGVQASFITGLVIGVLGTCVVVATVAIVREVRRRRL